MTTTFTALIFEMNGKGKIGAMYQSLSIFVTYRTHRSSRISLYRKILRSSEPVNFVYYCRKTYGMFFHTSLTLLYLIFLVLLTYMHVASVQTELIPALAKISLNNLENFAPGASNSPNFHRLRVYGPPAPKAYSDYAAAFVICLIVSILLIKELMELFSKVGSFRVVFSALHCLDKRSV